MRRALALLAAAGCDRAPDAASRPPNVLVVITDDQGADQVTGWPGADVDPLARTPNLAALAAEGLRFTHAWATPVCSPSRAQLMTGRYGRRTGIGAVVYPDTATELPLDELTLPEALAGAGYTSSFVGKWHLAAYGSPTGTQHPRASGFDWFAGSMSNLNEEDAAADGEGGYRRWRRIDERGEVGWCDTYATTSTVDDALARVEAMPEPWLLVVSLHAGHTPLHDPPEALLSEAPGEGDAERYRAILEAADTEVGRLLDGVAPVRDRTVVWVLSDNGSPDFAYDTPTDAKNSTAELGLRVPFAVSGPGIPRGERDALVSLVDVLPTIVALAGLDPDVLPTRGPLDGRSLVPLLHRPEAAVREVVYSEKFLPNAPGGPAPLDGNDIDWQVVRDARFKLAVTDGVEHLYDLDGAGDAEDLLVGALSADAATALDTLRGHLDGLRAAMAADAPGP